MAVVKTKRPVQDVNLVTAAGGYITQIMKGMKLTLHVFFKQLLHLEKTETLEWPEEEVTYGDRFKGKHFLTRREDGQVRCTACFLCVTACPADCIYIEAGEHSDHTIEKFPVRFEIDILRCVFCGYCEEACPVDAIRLGPEYAIAGKQEEQWIYTKDFLTARKELPLGGLYSIKSENDKDPSVCKSRTG